MKSRYAYTRDSLLGNIPPLIYNLILKVSNDRMVSRRGEAASPSVGEKGSAAFTSSEVLNELSCKASPLKINLLIPRVRCVNK